MRKFWGFLFFTISCLLLSSPVGASDTSTAELLFQKGRAKMVAQDFDAACQLFEESRALDPAVGTVMNLAACEAKRGQLKHSFHLWNDALEAMEEDDPRRSFAEEQRAEVDRDLPRLTIIPEPGSPQDLIIFQDGEELTKSQIGVEMRTDPGAHLIIVRSKEHKEHRYHFPLDPGQTKEIVVTPGARLPKPPDPLAQQRSLALRKGLTYGAFGMGAAGAIGALVTGLMLPRERDLVQANCNQETRSCNAVGNKAAARGRTLVAVNTASWIVGGIGLAAGGALVFTLVSKGNATPEDSGEEEGQPSVQMAIGASSVKLMGSF